MAWISHLSVWGLHVPTITVRVSFSQYSHFFLTIKHKQADRWSQIDRKCASVSGVCPSVALWWTDDLSMACTSVSAFQSFHVAYVTSIHVTFFGDLQLLWLASVTFHQLHKEMNNLERRRLMKAKRFLWKMERVLTGFLNKIIIPDLLRGAWMNILGFFVHKADLLVTDCC